MITEGNTAKNEAEIRHRVESWTKAVCAKDLDALMGHYAQDILVFDLVPPLHYKGAAAYRKNWADWFSSFRGPIGYEIRDLNITMGEDVAFSYSLNRISGKRTSGEQTNVWVRATVGFSKISGRWMITHEHFSVPFDMEPPYKASLDLNP